MATANTEIPKFLSGQTIGIDLGTTFSAVAQLNSSGVPVAVKNVQGELSTPSVIILGEAGHIYVGASPDVVSATDPQKVIQAIKREMGNSRYMIMYQGRRLTPDFLSALILKKLKQDSERLLGPVANAVITVPYYFNDICRRATQNAGRIAGLNVVDIINEPTAATLAYAWMKGELGRGNPDAPDKTILVYDLGGGTFDVTVVRCNPSQFRVIATDGDVRLGGIDWTFRIVQHVANEFKKRYRYDPLAYPEERLLFEQKCERAKRILSTATEAIVDMTVPGRTLTVGISRAEFESLTADLMQRTRDTTELVLEQAGIEPRELDEILLVGGSTHMPLVSWTLRELTNKVPSRDLNPDLAVAQGAAIHAAILEARATDDDKLAKHPVLKRLRGVRAQDVNSHSLGVVVTDPANPQHKFNHIMIPRNTPIPARVSQQFVTTLGNPATITLHLLEGESEDVSACTLIGDFRITGLPPNLPAGSPVEVTYHYDARGRIHASARELVGNRAATFELVHESGLSDAGLTNFQTLAESYQVE